MTKKTKLSATQFEFLPGIIASVVWARMCPTEKHDGSPNDRVAEFSLQLCVMIGEELIVAQTINKLTLIEGKKSDHATGSEVPTIWIGSLSAQTRDRDKPIYSNTFWPRPNFPMAETREEKRVQREKLNAQEERREKCAEDCATAVRNFVDQAQKEYEKKQMEEEAARRKRAEVTDVKSIREEAHPALAKLREVVAKPKIPPAPIAPQAAATNAAAGC